MKYALTLLISVLWFNIISAQTEPIDSDRPDFSESAIALTKDILQIETGFVVQNSSADGEGFEINLREVSLLNTLLRYGLLNGIELRAGFGYLYQRNSSAGVNELEGINELLLGTKIQIIKNRPSLPDIALMAHLGIPGNSNFEPSKIEPELILAFGNELSDIFELEYNLGSTWAVNDKTVYALYAISLGAGLTEDLGAFLEFYGEAANGIEFGKNIDGGFTYLLQENFQLDVSAGISLDTPEDNWFFGVGGSIRLPE